MRKSLFLLMGIAVAATPIQAQTPKPAAGTKTSAPAKTAEKKFVAPKTPWGDPDLQGTWTSDDYINTPMQRNAQFGDRLFATPEEITQAESQIKTRENRNSEEF